MANGLEIPPNAAISEKIWAVCQPTQVACLPPQIFTKKHPYVSVFKIRDSQCFKEEVHLCRKRMQFRSLYLWGNSSILADHSTLYLYTVSYPDSSAKAAFLLIQRVRNLSTQTLTRKKETAEKPKTPPAPWPLKPCLTANQGAQTKQGLLASFRTRTPEPRSLANTQK